MVIGLLSISARGSGQESLSLAMMADWKPYLYLDEKGNTAGDDLELLEKVLSRIGYQLNSKNLPEQRMAMEIKHGEVDVTLAAAYTPGREHANFYSIPYRTETIVFGFRHNLHPEFQQMTVAAVLAGNYLVAVNKGGWFGKAFAALAREDYASQMIHAEGTQRRMVLLEMNRVDAVVGDHKVLAAAAKDIGIDDFVISEQVIHQTPVHFMFSRSRVDRHFMQQFNAALKDVLKEPQSRAELPVH